MFRRWLLVLILSSSVLVLAATPAAAATPQNVRYFPQTGHYVSNGFLAYWEHFGGLAAFGYPITNELQENGIAVQYFERARFEWHPGSNPARYDVELGLVGQEAAARYGSSHLAGFSEYFIPTRPNGQSDCIYISQTQHNLCAGFLAYWKAYGGLATFGYPISEELRQENPDAGGITTVQYFQRARFEWHPGSDPARFDVELGRVGVEVLEVRHPDLIPQCHCEHPS